MSSIDGMAAFTEPAPIPSRRALALLVIALAASTALPTRKPALAAGETPVPVMS